MSVVVSVILIYLPLVTIFMQPVWGLPATQFERLLAPLSCQLANTEYAEYSLVVPVVSSSHDKTFFVCPPLCVCVGGCVCMQQSKCRDRS